MLGVELAFKKKKKKEEFIFVLVIYFGAHTYLYMTKN